MGGVSIVHETLFTVWARFMRAAHGAGIPAEKGSNKRRVAKWRVQG